MLVLDSGSELAVHSNLLEMRSQVLADAVSLAAQDHHSSSKLRISLPAVSDRAGQLLVRVVYSLQTEKCLLRLNLTQLTELAHVCHRYAMTELLVLVDEVLQASWLRSVPRAYWEQCVCRHSLPNVIPAAHRAS